MSRLDPTIRRRISSRVDQASADPARFAMRLVGSPFFRLRVGDWRVILSIDHGRVTVVVLEVKHRRSAYR
jgi:mRNA interferase RelE/StbE